MATSFKRTYASTLQILGLLYSVPLTPGQATVNLCLSWKFLDTHRQAWLNFLWYYCSFLLGLGAHRVLFVPSRSLFPQSCGSSVIKSHWPSKSNSLGLLSPFARSPRLENLFWALELSQQCENFFGIIVFQFVDCLCGGSLVRLTCYVSQVYCSQNPCSHGRPLLTRATARDTQTLKGRSGSIKRWQSKKTYTHLLLGELQNCNSLLNNHQQENAGSQ